MKTPLKKRKARRTLKRLFYRSRLALCNRPVDYDKLKVISLKMNALLK
jgi:hypothetical protein